MISSTLVEITRSSGPRCPDWLEWYQAGMVTCHVRPLLDSINTNHGCRHLLVELFQVIWSVLGGLRDHMPHLHICIEQSHCLTLALFTKSNLCVHLSLSHIRGFLSCKLSDAIKEDIQNYMVMIADPLVGER